MEVEDARFRDEDLGGGTAINFCPEFAPATPFVYNANSAGEMEDSRG